MSKQRKITAAKKLLWPRREENSEEENGEL